MSAFIRVLGPRDPKSDEVLYVNTTSRSLNWSKGLSPFFLGPVDLYGSYTAKNVENGWQYSKVYPQHLNKKGLPSSKYFDWAEKGWSSPYAARYPMGKGAIPAYSWWNGKKLSYIKARKQIYVPIYKKAVKKTDAWLRLKKLWKNSETLVLWDFDAYDHRSLGMTWEDVLNDPTRKCGHGFVLAMMLEKYI